MKHRNHLSKILAMLLAAMMVIGLLPVSVFAATNLNVADNVIDITDRTIGSISSYYGKATALKINGATVVAAEEDGTTINITLASDTPADAVISTEFVTAVSRFTVSGTTGTVTLADGAGELSQTLDAKYNGSFSRGTATYKIVFACEEIPVDPPTCLKKTESHEVYKGLIYSIDLRGYFTSAKTYYLVNGEQKTALENSVYEYVFKEAGTYTLVFAASNDIGECSDRLTVTVKVKEIESGIWIGHNTSNGSLDSVIFTDAQGNMIDGIIVTYANKNISVTLPKTYDLAGKITATFSRTANSSGFPLASSSNAFNQGSGSKTDVYTNTLSNGAATRNVYLYNSAPKATSNVYDTFVISYKIANDIPVLAAGISAAAEASVTAGEAYMLDLTKLFTDADGDALTYLVSINGAAAVSADAAYSYTNNTAGTYTLVFTANDGKDTSSDTYTVTLTIKDTEQTDSMTLFVPEDITPSFFVSTGFGQDGIDEQGAAVKTEKGETQSGLTAYTISYPTNAEMISVRAEGWGGMAFPVDKDGSVTLRKVRMDAVDYENNAAESTNTVTYDGHIAEAGTNGWLLAAGRDYIFTAVPKDTTTLETVSETKTLEAGTDVYELNLMLGIKNPLTITVPTGAKAQVYQYNKYYSNTEFEAKIIKDNGNGTTTFYFAADTKNGNFIYRVSMKDKITKAGWIGWGKQSHTFTWTEDDKAPSYRLDDYSGTGQANSSIAEDSVLLNINSRNHLSLSVGETTTLKAYRAWEIIPQSYNNYIIPPDFTYTILSGNDVVNLTEKASASAADSDWMTLTALKEGIAIVEVTYDAIDIKGGGYDGIYGASDPARTGLVVVQVGGSNDTSVDFGIDCFASAGKGYSDHIAYNADRKYAWDAEFDTIYFTEGGGELNFSPSANSSITEVSVSNDKGNFWKTLTAKDGKYTAKIVSGNNILRVKTSSGTAYQVVRGDKITVKIAEIKDKSDNDGIIEAGETVRVMLNGLHSPIPKMAGNYNPGYQGNYDAYSSQHLNYTYNGEEIHGIGAQYNFITAANYVDVTIPEEGSAMLYDGYIGLGVIGLKFFAEGGDSHRNIPDGGCATRGSDTTLHTRSILPEITVKAGEEAAENQAPIANANAVKEASIEEGQNYALNPEMLFTDPDGNELTFTVSVNGAAAEEATAAYKFTPESAGTYTLKFTASDGKETAEHTVTLTVKAKQVPPEDEPENKLTFDLKENEIKGYVTVSFEDKGIRLDHETGLKYPAALGEIIKPTQVPYAEGDSVARVTLRLLDALDMGYTYSGTVESGFYLGSIKNFIVDNTPYDEMGEMDAGSGSGWMITLNDVFINKGASDFTVKDGDIMKWQYTCQVGADIGDSFYGKDIENVENLIKAIGKVALDKEDEIDSARKAYDALNDFQKKQVSNYTVLEEAEKELAELKATDADKAAAEAVEKLIDEIGEVTLKSEKKIKAARKDYDELTDTQKALVENYDKLTAAENLLKILKNPSHEEIYRKTGDYLEKLGTPAVASIGGDWMALGLARSGRKVAEEYYANVIRFTEENIDENERLHKNKSTENARVILALTSLGYDVTNVAGHNLLEGLNDMSYLKKQGINGPIWALIAFDSHDYEIPAGGDVTREKLIETILAAQLGDHGWALSGAIADPDMTGMAIQALAPYYAENEKVKAAVDLAVEYLSKAQLSDGSYSGTDGVNAESAAQVITALTALGIDPETDERFVKNGISVVDALCSFALDKGVFQHILDGKADGMATEQSYYALAAYFRMLNGQTGLFDMSDVKFNDAAESVESLIDAIGKVTAGSETVIKAARAAYDALSAADKAKVKNYNKLTKAEEAYAEIDARISEAEGLIDAIGTVKFDADSKAKINAARKAYEKLSAEEQKYVENIAVLTDAEELYADLEAAQKVIDLIDAIGEVTEDSEDDIDKARKAYDKLTKKQKALVTNYSELTAAERKWEFINPEGKTKVIGNGDTKVVIGDTTYMVDKEAAKLMKKIIKLNDSKNPTDEMIIEAYKNYAEMTDKLKAQIFNYDDLEALTNALGVKNRMDEALGMEIEGDTLEWYIRLSVKKVESGETYKAVAGSIGSNDLIALWDIELINTLTGEKVQPADTVMMRVANHALAEYENFRIVHYTDDGKMEYHDCVVADGYVSWEADSFSHYALIGGNGEALEMLEEDAEQATVTVGAESEGPERTMLWLWIMLGAVGILLIVLAQILKNRKNN